MRKFVIVSLLLAGVVLCGFSQSGKVTLSVGEVKVSKLNPGDKVNVPVKLINESGVKIVGLQLFVGFDHSILSWDGTMSNPTPGVRNFNAKCPYSSTEWMFNDNGSQMGALWNEASITAIEFDGEFVLFEYVFTYKGGLEKGGASPLSWGATYKDVEGRLVLGKTEVYDGDLKLIDLNFVDGKLVN
jgi:hypothetical protein